MGVPPGIERIGQIAIPVEDLERAVTFNSDVLTAPIDKLSVVLVALFAVAVLGERPSVRDWVGIACVAAGALLLSLRR